ncbi:MAG: glycosyltransferase [Deltaproteobacteria bacterium]|nr:glycosyltransferase [Deltaproteobacteria bacterium]
MQAFLLVLFIAAASFVWMLSFGYLGYLLWSARGKAAAAPRSPVVELPPVAVIVPVLNEDGNILDKLSDLAAQDYPQKLLSIWVVDGGSHDDTRRRVEEAASRFPAIHLLRADGANGKSDQINFALANIGQEFLVFNDADARLAPDCIRRLILGLRQDPGLAVLGARVEPSTELPEEKLHWWLLNLMWWLEGRAWGAAKITGVCFACRRSLVLPLSSGTRGDDLHMATKAYGRGYRVGILRSARAWEVRVPHTRREMLEFRLKRGAAYLHELRHYHSGSVAHRPGGASLRANRWQIRGMPLAALVAAAAGLGLLAGGAWMAPALVALAFLASASAIVLAYRRDQSRADSLAALLLTLMRMMAIDGYSMLLISSGKQNRQSGRK